MRRCPIHLQMQSQGNGDEAHTYMGFISENGMEVANSVYLGSIAVEGLRSARNDDVISINPKQQS